MLNRRSLIAPSALAWLAAPLSAAYAQATYSFDLPAQELARSLREAGSRTGSNIVFDPAIVRGRTAPALRGTYSAEQAVAALLRGSGLAARRTDGGSFVIEREPATQAAAAGGDRASAASEAEDAQEIVVTGTNIRGANPASSALDIYRREDFEKLGVNTVDQLLSQIPQNLNSTGSVGANSIGRAINARNINAPDLRGLGPGATLSLLNGHRLPLANLGRAPDVSLIPLGAVDRVEVLTDGASSVYGADAVGGVINFILRDHYEGALTSVSYTVRGDGGYSAAQLDQTAGVDWRSGGGLVSLSGRWARPLKGQDVDFVDSPITTLSPTDDRLSAFFSAHQDIGDRTKAFVDLLYSHRESESTTDEVNFVSVNKSNTEQLFGSIGFATRLTDRIALDLNGTYGRLNDRQKFSRFISGQPVSSGTSPQTFDSVEIEGKIDGTLFDLASEKVLFALGGGYLKQKLDYIDFHLGRETRYGFGELAVPIVGPGRDIPLIQRLELNLSARYTSTSDFGDSFDPKIGAYWRLVDSLAVRGTWSRSFRAPELLQLVPPEFSGLEILAVDSPFGTFPDPFSAERSTVYLAITDVSNPDLQPETSEAFTLGFDFAPPSIKTLHASATYYNINYTNRIAFPPGISEIAQAPQLYSNLIGESSLAAIEDLVGRSFGVFDYSDFSFDPAPDPAALAGRVTRIVRSGITNIASQKTSGVDVSVDYGWSLRGLKIITGIKATHTIRNDEKTNPNSPTFARLNRVSYPVDFRGRAYASLTRGGWSGNVVLNYVNAYLNTTVSPEARVDSWTTLDLSTSYTFGKQHGGVRLALNVQNVFNSNPPFVASSPGPDGSANGVNYDAANHNPFGRLFVVSLTKDW